MKWEYKTIKLKTKGWAGGKFEASELDAMMNELGIEGWELASTTSVNEGYGSTRGIVLIFKRAITQ